MHLTTASIIVGTGCEDARGVQIFADGALIAIFVRLDGPCHADGRGRWFLEASFGVSHGAQPGPFEYLSEALTWLIRGLVGVELDEAVIDRLEIAAEHMLAGTHQ